MQLGLIGLGKMGANMTRRLPQDRHEVVDFDLDEGAAMRNQFGGHNVKSSDE